MATMKSPPVSVAMITYNHEAFVGEAVASILAQTYGDFELIVVDDGSTDRTADVLRSVRDERLVCIRQTNQGPSEARNTALRAARGEVIAQMSGDDVAEPRRLERQLAHHREAPDSVVFSHCTPIDDRGRPIDAPALQQLVNRANWPAASTLRHLFFVGNCFLAPSAVASRAAFADVGPYKPTLWQAQDYDMWTRFLLKGYQPHIVQEPLLRYRIRSGGVSLSADTPARRARDHFELPRILREFLVLDTAKRLSEIFPTVDALGYPLEDELVPFLLAKLALARSNRSRILERFAADVLVDLMERPETRRRLSQRAGFENRDLFEILGEIDPPGPMAQPRMLTRPWRACAKRLRTWSRGPRIFPEPKRSDG
jgi:glycosyltransferase involved in cell wall biosynthesis